MTRRFRPRRRLDVRCAGDGALVSFHYKGERRHVTRVVSTWDVPASWWADDDPDPFLLARVCQRIVADDCLVCEVFRAETGQWYLSRVID